MPGNSTSGWTTVVLFKIKIFLKTFIALAMKLWNSTDCRNLTYFPSLTVFTFSSAWQGQWSAGLLFQADSLSGDLVPFLCLYFLVLSALGEGLKQRFSLGLEKPCSLVSLSWVLCYSVSIPFPPIFHLGEKKSQIWNLYWNDCFFNYDVSKSLGASRGGNIPAGLEQVRSPGHGLLLNLWFTLQQD